MTRIIPAGGNARAPSPFLASVIAVLGVTAVAKLAGAAGDAPLLALPDPLLGASNRTVIVLAAVMELVLAAVVWRRGRSPTTYLLLIWFSSLLLTYRASVAVLAPGRPCPCLGTLTDRIGMSPPVANALLLTLVLYILAGSMLAWARSSDRDQETCTAQSA